MCNRRKHLVWVAGLAMALGATGVANAASTQHIEAAMCAKSPCPLGSPPPKLPKKTFDKGAALTVRVFATGASGIPPHDTIPTEAKTSDVDFDKDIKFTTKGLPRCDVSQIGGDTASARAACPKSIIGDGSATAQCDGGLSIPTTVTAFAGTPKDSPNIIFHAYAQPPVATTLPIVGTLIDSPKPGFGKRLHVPVDMLLGGACTLTDFTVTTEATLKSGHGSHKKVTHLISGRCKGDKSLAISSDWEFYFGAPSVSDIATTVPCRAKG